MRGVFAAAIRERDARGVYAIVTYERVAAAYPPLIRPCGATFPPQGEGFSATHLNFICGEKNYEIRL